MPKNYACECGNAWLFYTGQPPARILCWECTRKATTVLAQGSAYNATVRVNE